MATTLFSDSFNGGAVVSGRTLDNAGGGTETVTWNVITAGTWAIVTDQLTETGSANAMLQTSGGSNPNDQRSSITPITTVTSGGPVCRWTSGTSDGSYYLYYRVGTATTGQVYRRDNGTTFTQLGANGSNVANGAVMSIEAVGTGSNNIVARLNGSADMTRSDATYASGAMGVYSQNQFNTGVYDDFKAESMAASGGAFARFQLMGMGH